MIPGPKEAVMGGADWEGPGQTPRLLLRPAGRACHRGPGHADGGSLRLADAPGQLHQSSGRTHRYGPHLGQDAQLQGGWVRERVLWSLVELDCKKLALLFTYSLSLWLWVTLFFCCQVTQYIHTYTVDRYIEPEHCQIQGSKFMECLHVSIYVDETDKFY